MRVWDASTGKKLWRLSGHSSRVRSVAISSDGTRIVSGSNDSSVRVWDASTGAELRRLNGHSSLVLSVAFLSDGSRIVSGSTDNSMRVWDVVDSDSWEFSTLGWITSPPHSQCLMWVPQDLMKTIKLHNVLIISSEPPAEVDFTDSRIGPVWAACYTPYLF